MFNVVAVSKGSGAMLLKAKTKRRRSKAEILAAKEAALTKLREEVEKDKKINQLKDQLQLSQHAQA